MSNPECTEPVDADTAGMKVQVERILRSTVFNSAPTLSGILKFITDRTIQGRTAEISEYAIATQVLGRSPDFDPSSDTIVRTQAYRLRAKLQQYYAGPGSEDTIIIDVPKGHYIPVFRFERREVLLIEQPQFPEVAEPPSVQRTWLKAFAGVALVAGLCWASWLLGAGSARTQSKPSSLVAAFWQSFLLSDRLPVVSYSNHRFVGTNRGTLIPLRSGSAADRGVEFPRPPGVDLDGALRDIHPDAGPLFFQDDYTGVGEVLASISLFKVLEHQSDRVEVKRSHLLSTFDFQSHNVIILGSAADTHPMLGELPPPRKFVRVRSPRKWEGSIKDLSPEAGAASTYTMDRDPASGVLKTDYAIVSVMPGIAPGKRILVLGGLTTSGTAAAAAILTELDGVSQLANKLGVKDPQTPKNWPTTFESVWRVELSRGLDVVSARVVAARSF